MTVEVEVKARLTDPAAIEAQLREQADFAGETHKSDVYFRLPPGPPLQSLRLRREGAASSVTTKRKALVDGVEVNEEIEFEVGDARALCQVLERFGFEPYATKRKACRVYRAGRVTLELCEVEGLGHFLEIEILCQSEAEAVAAREEVLDWLGRLNIPRDAVEPAPYTRLIAELHPAGYVFVHDDPDVLVRAEPRADAGRRERRS